MNTSKPIVLDAIYINTGGGLELLKYLVSKLIDRRVKFVLLKDSRSPVLERQAQIYEVVTLAPSLLARHNFYRQNRKRFKKVLCFGNLPPTLRMPVPVYTYFHNVNLLKIPIDYSFAIRFKSYIKRRIIKRLSKYTSCWFVQTDYTKRLVLDYLALKGQEVLLYPFFNLSNLSHNLNRVESKFREDYVFISLYTGAKGHEYLVEAWVKLASKGVRKKLHLTVDDPEFSRVIEQAVSNGANIENHGQVSFAKVMELYNKAKAIVYPSLNESLGLGIVEAIAAGCDVIGCNMPYLYSVCEPSITFEPRDSDSIVRAVMEYERGSHKKSAVKVHDTINDLIEIIS